MFSPACYKHCSTAENIMFHTTVNGETLSERLIKWFKGELPKSKRMNIAKCKGRNCSNQCSKIPINSYNPMKPPYVSVKIEGKSENEPEEKSDKEPVQIKVLKSKHGRRSRTQGIKIEEQSENEPEEKSDKESDNEPVQIKVLKSKHGRRSRTQGI